MKISLLIFTALIFAALASVSVAQSVSITATAPNAAEMLAGQTPINGNIRITRTGSTASPLTVWVKVDGTADQGLDYTFGSVGTIGTTVVIPAGSSILNIPVIPIDDSITEDTEEVRINLSSKTSSGANVPYAVGSPNRAIVSIADNEPRATVTVAVVDAIATETPDNSDPAVFRITRTGNLTPALSVLYSLGGTATPGVDYTALPATITVPAGAASVDVTIMPIDDELREPNETVIFTLLPTTLAPAPEAYLLGTAITATATIISDEQPIPPVVTITSSNVALTNQPYALSYTAIAPDGYIVSTTVSANWTSANSGGGPTNFPASTPAGTPFNGTGSLTFTGNLVTANLTVQATNNLGVTGTATMNVWIFTAPPQPQKPVLPNINIYPLIVQGAEVAGGQTQQPASFRVTHDFPATATVSFLFQMGGTAKEGANQNVGGDYTLSSAGTFTNDGLFGRWFTFPPGTTEAVIFVNPVDDQLVESTETVTMSLYTPPFIGVNDGTAPAWDWQSNFGFFYGASPTATVSILDNDTAPPPFPLITITASKSSGSETTDGSDPAIFTVTRTSGPTDVPLTVNYSLTTPPKQTIYTTEPRPTMAQNGVDFPLLPGTVTIPVGATSADIVVVPTYDLLVETPELLEITLLPSVPVWPAPGGYVIDQNITADANILDAVLPGGTPVVLLRVTDAFAYHELFPGRTASFAVTRSGGNLTQPLDVSYTVSGTATNGVDYVYLPGVITIPAGKSLATILINPYTAYSGQVESVVITLDTPPTDISPPPYAVGSTFTMPRTAGIAIVDHLNLSPKQRALILRRRHLVIPLPPIPPPGPVASPSVAGATAAPAPVDAPTVWAVEASVDLANWEVIGTTDPSGEYGDFVDVNAGDFPSRFYRFRPLP